MRWSSGRRSIGLRTHAPYGRWPEFLEAAVGSCWLGTTGGPDHAGCVTLRHWSKSMVNRPPGTRRGDGAESFARRTSSTRHKSEYSTIRFPWVLGRFWLGWRPPALSQLSIALDGHDLCNAQHPFYGPLQDFLAGSSFPTGRMFTLRAPGRRNGSGRESGAKVHEGGWASVR
jgi:hypothetical protein